MNDTLSLYCLMLNNMPLPIDEAFSLQCRWNSGHRDSVLNSTYNSDTRIADKFMTNLDQRPQPNL